MLQCCSSTNSKASPLRSTPAPAPWPSVILSRNIYTQILVLFTSIVLCPLACPLAISYKGTLLKKEALLLVLRSPFLGLERLVVVGTSAGKSIYC
jgi:hypothetical protein